MLEVLTGLNSSSPSGIGNWATPSGKLAAVFLTLIENNSLTPWRPSF